MNPLELISDRFWDPEGHGARLQRQRADVLEFLQEFEQGSPAEQRALFRRALEAAASSPDQGLLWRHLYRTFTAGALVGFAVGVALGLVL